MKNFPIKYLCGLYDSVQNYTWLGKHKYKKSAEDHLYIQQMFLIEKKILNFWLKNYEFQCRSR